MATIALHSITVILALITSFTLCFVVWIYDRSRRDRLKERERLLDHKVKIGTFDGYAPQFIFCKLWTIEHLKQCADQLEIILTKDEMYMIIRRINAKFSPVIGISQYVLKCEIRLFVREQHLSRLNKPLPPRA